MILIDGNLLAHRAFHKMDFLKNMDGVPTGLEYGFLRSIEFLERKFPTHKIIICFDTKRNFKRENHKRYKSGRSTMEGTFYTRLGALQRFLSSFWDMAWQEGIEADDVMYTIAKDASEEAIIYSNDNDLLQCVDDEKRITVLKSHDSNLYRYDEAQVEEKFGVGVKHLVMLRSFLGDSSDSLKGVGRIQRSKLIEAIMLAEYKHELTDPATIAFSIPQYTGWSPNMQMKIESFIERGLWAGNYELMKLQEVPITYTTKLAEPDDDYILKMLLEWEIGSLKLCAPYKEKLVDPESEF